MALLYPFFDGVTTRPDMVLKMACIPMQKVWSAS